MNTPQKLKLHFSKEDLNKTQTHMLLSVRQDLPQPGEELDPRLLGQRGGDVAELDEGAEQGSRLQGERPSGARPPPRGCRPNSLPRKQDHPLYPTLLHCLTFRT